MIRSHSNPLIKSTLQLRRSSSRRKAGRFLIDGRKEIMEAIEGGFQVDELFLSPSSALFFSEEQTSRVARCVEVSEEILAKLSYGQRHDSPVAIGRTPEFELEALALHSNSVLLVLDRTEKPGNLGACLRTAAASGVDAVVLTDPICEPMNPNAIRASRGAIFRLPIAVASIDELESVCGQNQIQLLCARVESKQNLWDCDLCKGVALAFGNEAEGLGPRWSKLPSFVISMSDRADSLNLSISAAVTLYEVARQRRSGNLNFN